MRKTFLLLLLLITSYTFAQDSTKSNSAVVKGFVKNKDGKFIMGANVVIEGTIDGATSDEKGFYEFETDKTGDRVIICSRIPSFPGSTWEGTKRNQTNTNELFILSFLQQSIPKPDLGRRKRNETNQS